jgi:hypothetical protein
MREPATMLARRYKPEALVLRAHTLERRAVDLRHDALVAGAVEVAAAVDLARAEHLVERTRRCVVFLDREPALVDAVDDVAHERADQLDRDARALELGDDRERRAVRLALAHERQQIPDRAIAIEREKARVFEHLRAQPQVVRA